MSNRAYLWFTVVGILLAQAPGELFGEQAFENNADLTINTTMPGGGNFGISPATPPPVIPPKGQSTIKSSSQAAPIVQSIPNAASSSSDVNTMPERPALQVLQNPRARNTGVGSRVSIFRPTNAYRPNRTVRYGDTSNQSAERYR
jgi:hypothetical protein